MGNVVGSVDLEAGRRWFSAAKEGRDLVTVAERNGAAATLGALMDLLAEPQTVLPRGAPAADEAAPVDGVSLGALRLPMTTYRGPDAALRGREVPLVGAIPPPSWWASGGEAPSTLPAWVRATDRERRSLYGALASVAARLAGEGQANPDAGTGGARGTGNPWLIGAVALGGLAAWAYVARGAAGDLIREVSTTHRFAEQAATTVKLYAERLRTAANTGVMPVASPAEVALNPAPAANGAPPAGSPRQVGDAWWDSLGGDAMKVGAGALGFAALAALATWAWKKVRGPQAEPQMDARAMPWQQPSGSMPPAMGGR